MNNLKIKIIILDGLPLFGLKPILIPFR